jgi:glyoxylase I family protein
VSRLHHLDLVVSSVQDSLAFYRDLLVPLGWTDLHEATGERGEPIVYLLGEDVTPLLGLRQRQADGDPPPHDRYELGVHHVAFTAPSRDDVDAAAARMRDRGAQFDGEPGDRDYIPGYYAFYCLDPDGIKVEVVCID